MATACAGLFFLIRVIADLRLPWLARDVPYPVTDAADQYDPLTALLFALGHRLAGPMADADPSTDPGLRLFAGIPDGVAGAALDTAWDATNEADSAHFQERLLAILAGQRVTGASTLRLEWLTHEGRDVLMAGSGDQPLWLFGRVLDSPGAIETIAAEWLDAVERVIGTRPAITLGEGLAVDPGAMARQLGTDVTAGGDALAAATVLAAIAATPREPPGADITLALTANALLRTWARWLPRFGASTTPYLLEVFVRRPGRIAVGTNEITVWPKPGPLDVVLEMAGYLEEVESVPWLGDRRIRIVR
jgi:hypothetical protein